MNTTYLYDGSGTTGAFVGSVSTGSGSVTYWFALSVKYGSFLEAQNFNVLNFPQVVTSAPQDLPSLISSPAQPPLAPQVTLWNQSRPFPDTSLTLVSTLDIKDIDTNLTNDFKGAVYVYQTPPLQPGAGTFYVN